MKLTGNNNYSGDTTIGGGILQGTIGTNIPSGSFLRLDGGVLQFNGAASFTRSLGTSGSNSFQWAAGGGGFSAGTGELTVNVGNDSHTLVWGTAPECKLSVR